MKVNKFSTLIFVSCLVSGLSLSFSKSAQAGFFSDAVDSVNHGLTNIDPTNQNSAVREGLRNVDPTSGNIYVNNNTNQMINVQIEADTGLDHHFIIKPGQQKVLVENNVLLRDYIISGIEIDTNNRVLKGGVKWKRSVLTLTNRGYIFSFNE
ncbi:MAG: hypothetical protein HCA25_22580 [Dolichospermum sp. DET50]|nr:hypothetical protein [Dolichospermum sp. DET66]MBS3034956.1 hypothetical protein [Dolichospermum sp. DET67]MBS3040157.1 hypothetical protein [Dolichospermum sp. DET50]QSX67331.1 MAG: hypothetical protein EZY12_21850 [Dolichospermum sp. DET69]